MAKSNRHRPHTCGIRCLNYDADALDDVMAMLIRYQVTYLNAICLADWRLVQLATRGCY